MGGYGSTRWRSTATRPVVEDALVLDGYTFIPEAKKFLSSNPQYTSAKLTWRRNGEPYANIEYFFSGDSFILDYSKNGEPVPPYSVRLSPNPQPKGGLRYLFICPLKGCGRRTAKLYLPAGAKYFGCRECYQMTYTSSNESHKFDGLFRLLAKDTGLPIDMVKSALKRL